RAKSVIVPLSYTISLQRVKGLESLVAGPERFEPSTVPRTRLVGSFFRLRASASMSLLLYLAEPPGQTLDDPAYGPRRPAESRELRISIKDCDIDSQTFVRGFETDSVLLQPFLFPSQISPSNTMLPRHAFSTRRQRMQWTVEIRD